jgi:hypothetical protein
MNYLFGVGLGPLGFQFNKIQNYIIQLSRSSGMQAEKRDKDGERGSGQGERMRNRQSDCKLHKS